MTTGSESPGPSYITSRSADVILSDVRPIKLKLDALQSINVLLDELLYNILSASHSLSTDKFKIALSKLVPTNLGKEALLEAEIELKAYHERTKTHNSDDTEGQFHLQWSFELLRIKCEAYSTMNDSDEDADAEKQLNLRMQSISGLLPPKSAFVAPAALYLTAILESFCEHILSNVGRVVTRDSSRVVASAQDLFAALCEDSFFYDTFKTMKVYEQIENLSKAQRPRRSKSFSKSSDRTSAPSRTSSSYAEQVSLRDSTSTPAKTRMSSDSFRSNAPTSVVSGSDITRTSSEKFGGLKNHSRSLSDKIALGEIVRTESGKTRVSDDFEVQNDHELLQEFDELVRSGATMKVSLTPDRLKTMEVYNKEKIQRNNKRGPRDTDSSVEKNATSPELPHPTRRPSLQHVDSIAEDEETSIRPPMSQPMTTSASRSRMISSAAQSSQAEHAGRLRSVSITDVPHPRHEDGIPRKAGTSPRTTSLQSSTMSPFAGGAVRNGGHGGSSNDFSSHPPKTRRIGKRLDSLDIDDIMGDSDDEVERSSVRNSKASTIRSSTSTVSPSPLKTPSTPYVSRAARELIAFLEEGPPEEPHFASPSVNTSVISFESTKTKTGRLQRMISRLTVGGSSERLNGRGPSNDSEQIPRSLSRKSSGKVGPTSPPPSFRQSSLSSKRSMPNVIVATPPPPPPAVPSVVRTSSRSPAQLSTPPMSSASSSQASVDELGAASPRRPVRKAAPVFQEKGGFPMPPSSPLPPIVPIATPITPRSGAEPLTPKTPSRRTANGHMNDNAVTVPAADDEKDVQIVEVPPQVLSSSTRYVNGRTSSPTAKDEKQDELPVPPKTVSPAPAGPPASPKAVPPAPAGPRPFNSKPRTPTTPTSGVEKIISGPTINPSSIDDLRQLLALATTADECRLLVDMFFARQGIPCRNPPSPSAISEATRAKVKSYNDNLENLVVEFLLGGGDVDEVATEASNAAEDDQSGGKFDDA